MAVTRNQWNYWEVIALLHLHMSDPGNLERLQHSDAMSEKLVNVSFDGEDIDWDDPCVQIFLDICCVSSIEGASVQSLVDGLGTWYHLNLTATQPKLGFAPRNQLATLFRLRRPGRGQGYGEHVKCMRQPGWLELDRLTSWLAGTPLSKLADGNPIVQFLREDNPNDCSSPFYAVASEDTYGTHEPSYLDTNEEVFARNCWGIGSSFTRILERVVSSVSVNDLGKYRRIYLFGPEGLIAEFPLCRPGAEREHGHIEYAMVVWKVRNPEYLDQFLAITPAEFHHRVRGNMFITELGV